MATRLSKRGAVTWWHLDDAGELVSQAALPLAYDGLVEPGTGPGGKPVVKIFIIVPKGAYALINQDEETNEEENYQALDILNTPDEMLPGPDEPYRVEDDPLPILWVAPLETGGRQFTLTPNVLHMVLTVQTCVMVEQRRISKLLLDDVLFLIARSNNWQHPPIVYEFVQQCLSDPDFLRSNVINVLAPLLENVDTPDQIRCRAYHSLNVALCNFAAPDNVDALAELLAANEQPLDVVAERNGYMISSMEEEVPGVLQVFDSANWDTHAESAERGWCCIVHESGRARYGPLRKTADEAAADKQTVVDNVEAGAGLQAAVLGLYKARS
eukprot:NODE_2020_length_1156_cov_68.090379_g2003_i0.p1 GENE.NODE_2020_length_1156_cov_68.090379_g2003_i0~~NODE_2020_length_1156_cov_68.090379_g2003_i0.p1  ORF type:complete len:353 (-),score=92.82 NODE_2020_length_1156_cov_68.090379_g2003_i0:98-1078(-)